MSASVAVQAPFIGHASAQSTTVIRVATWGGAWRDSLEKNVAGYLGEEGIRLQYVLGNPEENITKLITARRQGPVPFDMRQFNPIKNSQLMYGGNFEKHYSDPL